MTESFKDLLEESLTQTEMRPGSIVNARVIEIGRDYITVDAGLKSEGVIAIEEFKGKGDELEVSIGDEVEVALDMLEDGFGETVLSREKAKRLHTWNELEKANTEGKNVIGIITGKVKGGFTVEIANVRAFLPGSLVDVRPVRDSAYLEGKEMEFKVIKMDAKRNNIVVSRRAVVQEENSADRDALLESLAEGKEVQGIVKNLTDYGAFIDLGGIDGLLHITDISWKRVKHPSEILSVGQEVNVKVLKFDKERNRVSLGMKQMGDDPWVEVTTQYPEGAKLKGKVTNVTDYGCFVEIENGIEGLVHMSEMDWTNKNIHPNKVVTLGDEVEVMVLEIDQERRRISLGMKQCQSNPWDEFAATHKKGDKIAGKICSITDLGVFIGLEGDIDGLVHLSDLDWNIPGEEAVRNYKKGQEIEAMILGIDPERERISLGIKQLESDPFTNFTVTHAKGDTVSGKVTEVDPKQLTVELAEDVIGIVKASDIAKDKVEDARSIINEGDEIEAKITNIDKKNRVIGLSIKAAEAEAEAEVIKKYSKENTQSSSTTLGDLLKEKMTDNQND